MLFLEATQNKERSTPCVSRKWFWFVCCSSSSWILYVDVVVVALWCSKSPYNERDWQTATTAMAPGKFYAVRCGYIPGIYDTWVACQQQVVLHKINLPPNLAPPKSVFFLVGGVAFSMNQESWMLVLEGGNENDLHVCKWTWVLEF
jgi:hypothetical protein